MVGLVEGGGGGFRPSQDMFNFLKDQIWIAIAESPIRLTTFQPERTKSGPSAEERRIGLTCQFNTLVACVNQNGLFNHAVLQSCISVKMDVSLGSLRL